MLDSSSSLPLNPPDYIFEIEEDHENVGFFNKAQFKKLANNFNTRLIKIIDPIYEGYKYLQLQYEKSILKLGNPLVIKRLLYVFFMVFIIFLISKYSNNDSISGTSIGGFVKGKFYDIDKLSDSIKYIIDPKMMKENLEYFSSVPHITGTKGDLTLAKYIETYMKNNGINNIELNEYQTFTNYPSKNTYLKLKDGSWNAKLYESHNENMEFLSYNPNSLNTNEPIQGEYVYINYGTEEDFGKTDVKDKIVLLNYGGNIPESNKVFFAKQHEAKAVIFISPKFKHNEDVIQKENVGLTRVSLGDILTPGWSSEDGYVTRLNWDFSETTPKIPTLPISYKDGQYLISQADKGVELELKIANTNRQAKHIWNVVGSIEGREQNEKGIIIGAARDSSCYGTMSSNTGNVAFLELIKIFTSLQRKFQWSPSRSIYFASFDATEYNLAGSSEWIESRRELLEKEGYLYIDLSDLVSGESLEVNANPLLNEIVTKHLKKLKLNGRSLYDMADIKNEFSSSKNYLPFINLVNMPSLEIKFRGEYPQNSCYDDFMNFENSKIDDKMTKHSLLVELIAKIILEFAEYPLIPYNYNDFTNKLIEYEQNLENYYKSLNSDINLDFKKLKQKIWFMKEQGNKYENWKASWEDYLRKSGGIEHTSYSMARWRWNDNMVEFNSKFLTKGILVKRFGYRNILFGLPFNSPLQDDKFVWNSFPYIRNRLQLRQFEDAQLEINNLVHVLEQAAINLLL
ncbi:unnamed protein product [Candida verbasci]|uniref:Uncharacterized protein n=1 Tax=Candida verbasci TaxID=1227364 RepID=A0A9W4U005_9ASCO|nr:unnamed protein product [Candida verbasci]